MKERPILFSAPMVRAILAGTKTQTRRILKPQPELTESGWMQWKDGECAADCFASVIADDCPYGVPGDRLWVRETWFPTRFDCNDLRDQSFIRYAADGTYDPRRDCVGRAWKPSIHMPRWVSRITLEITRVRVERLQEISEHDAMAEGVTPSISGVAGEHEPPPKSHRTGFVRLWNEINGNWLDDPWVWVVEFRRLGN
jgi:hypothetical protein